jgi:hypothetical protein
MRHLIFTAATTSRSKGDLYLRMADVLIASLHRLARFSGDILVYTDVPSRFTKKGVCARRIADGIHPLEVRFTEDLDIDSYGNILFLDCDMLCVGPIDTLFDADGEVLFVYETNKLMNSEKFGHYFLSEDERARHKDEYIINAGTYCVDAAYYRHFADRWRSMWEKFITHPSLINNPYNDQSMLNAILRRGQVKCRSMGVGVVEFPFIFRNSDHLQSAALHEQCRFIHYNSDLTQQYKEADFDVIKRIYRDLCQ